MTRDTQTPHPRLQIGVVAFKPCRCFRTHIYPAFKRRRRFQTALLEPYALERAGAGVAAVAAAANQLDIHVLMSRTEGFRRYAASKVGHVDGYAGALLVAATTTTTTVSKHDVGDV